MSRLLVAVAILFMVGCKPAQTTKEPAAREPAGPEHRIAVYYLHNTFRCIACNSIESVVKACVLGGTAENGKTETKTEITAPYPTLVESGMIAFVPVNVDEEANKHFLTDFGTEGKIPIIAEIKGDTVVRFKALPDVWKHLGDDAALIAYVQNGVKEYAEDFGKK